jgi:PIN domain nuclease of toxin-antitoxin system
LDTHIILRWLLEPRKLSREQNRVIETAARRAEPVALSAMSLLEIAALASEGRLEKKLDAIFQVMQTNGFLVLPFTYEVANEFSALLALRDPGDRAIVATARVHGLQLVTSDQRIIASGLVPVIE